MFNYMTRNKTSCSLGARGLKAAGAQTVGVADIHSLTVLCILIPYISRYGKNPKGPKLGLAFEVRDITSMALL